ncbi:Predicted kinase, aminoglycoside phosphotransferase (APT) family [Raineyella antarctica]|uniref:Predicted kinase, aminoglycoside phosphotransferase (APT) family n=1 Tax=Raineyella antarctica TaxID=1577474 RepID=A0A1G6HD05_9ACTN|nr:aminoglycoside phosphotransferase family protein [Raineyella antarctica]SDB91316.1 Predicted kinase, aminoglycoside phosphotransferase (APT) family [Raineyella antarctica]
MSERLVSVTPQLVRRLLRSQLPPELAYLAEAPLELLGQGWDSVLYKLGDAHVVRVPQRREGAELAGHEIAWVEAASAPLRAHGIEAPIPIFTGTPGMVLPWPWTIVQWIPGKDVSQLPITERGGLVAPLARALMAIHRPAPREAPRNPYRGVPLRARARAVSDRWPSVVDWLGEERTAFLRAAWERSLRAPVWPGPPMWVHGDVHPGNLLQVEGRLVGIIDFGDVAAGDPAVDLAAAWLTFDRGQREEFWSIIDAEGAYDPAIRERSAGWAVMVYTALIADPITRRNFSKLIEGIRDQLT